MAILIYHDVVEDERRDSVGFPGPLAARYKHSPELFARHLEAIESSGCDIGLAANGVQPAAALTFDDGGSSAPLIAEMLEERGWRGHFFVTTERIGTPGFVGPDELRELAGRGHDVGSHSHTHPTYMGKLDRAALTEEWQRSRELLADVLGEAPTTAAVPGGFLSAAVVECAARAGYGTLMTSQPIRRVRIVGGMTVLGRYTIWSTTPPGRAAAYIRGSAPARAKLWLEWQLKGIAKQISPRAYETLRRLRA